MGATDEILHPLGTFRDISPFARVVLAWGGTALVVITPLLSPLLFTSAFELWPLFIVLLVLGLVLWLVGMNITMRRPNFFFLIAAAYAIILGIVNLILTNTVQRDILIQRYRYNADSMAMVANDLYWQNLWIIVAMAGFFTLFVVLHISMITRRRRQKNAPAKPRYRAEYA